MPQLFSSWHLERLRQLDHAIKLGIPTLRREIIAVEIASGGNFVAAVGEGQQPTPWDVGSWRRMIEGQTSRVDERRIPTPLDVRFAAVGVVGKRMSMGP